MPGILGKKFPTPIAEPMWPFFAAGVVVLYGVNSFANALSQGEEFRNDPRNPRFNENQKAKSAAEQAGKH